MTSARCCGVCEAAITRHSKSGLCRACSNRARHAKPAQPAAVVAAAPDIADADAVLRWLWAQATRDLADAGPRDRAALVKSAQALHAEWREMHPPPSERTALDDVADAVTEALVRAAQVRR